MRKKIHDTITAQVHAVVQERFANVVPFSTADILRCLPWVDEGDGTCKGVSRVSAALCFLARRGAVLIVEHGRGRIGNTYLADAETLKAYEPYFYSFQTGPRTCGKFTKQRTVGGVS